MSSHKCKKRKKDYKHQKDDIGLIEDDTDEHWSVQSSDSDNEDINQGKRLTSLVRKSYVHHLHGTLIQNYEEWKKTVKDIDSAHNIQRWVTVLEQRALRSCMVAELYQKTMLQMISDIKRSTQQSKLYINSEPVSKLNRLLPIDKEIQCELEARKAKKFSVETQTGKTYASLLDFPLPKSEPSAVSPVIRGQPIPTIDQIRDCVAKVTPVPRSIKNNVDLLSVDVNSTPYNPLINFSPCETIGSSNISHPPVSSAMDDSNSVIDNVQQALTSNVPTMVPPPRLTSNISISKILESISKGKDVNSSQVAPLKPLPLFETNLSKIKSNSTSRDDILLDLQSEFSNPGEMPGNKNSCSESNANNKSDHLFDILTEMELGEPVEVSKSSAKDLYSCKRKISKSSVSESKKSAKTSVQCKDGLDARLTAMGLLGDHNDNDEMLVDAKQKKNSNWSLEYVAQSCNLTRIMLRLHPHRRKKLIAKFEKLFGLPNEPETQLSEENIRICRKRIASVVVSELTPLYQAKRIGSRHLFKFLAKHATTTLMEKCYAPETRVIRRHVEELFVGNKDIESESDVLF